MFCSNCGKQYEGKFCPECGTPAAQPASDGSSGSSASGADLQTFPEVSESTNTVPVHKNGTKSPKKKRNGCLIAIIVIVVLGIIGSATGGNDSEAPSGSSSNVSSEPQSSSAVSSVPSVPADSIPADSAPTDSVPANSANNIEADSSVPESNTQISMDVVIGILKMSLSDAYGANYTIEGDETGITISIWQDNVAMGAAFIAQGNAELIESWNEMKSSLQVLCQGVKESVAELGFQDTPILINLLNDLDHEKMLLSILDGEVIYDCTQE